MLSFFQTPELHWVDGAAVSKEESSEFCLRQQLVKDEIRMIQSMCSAAPNF
ncbi:predicted protein [Sclerotinia sclerotiorum 1980 UF-70]|uniref:Uncharacterized protein n=1 Tax=Sclerotinia sclerotiorum (strain ATCC 18683 / 1980 / Ss-1) TaxID=665079 RepID=A7EYE1_SCLS1|nr:predicted protein [Sclerotinia sclerotiorum 1980 UF-70]EDN94483.1 predicted protein [Sclerotinia sclerotiorum 1980 UF-70]